MINIELSETRDSNKLDYKTGGECKENRKKTNTKISRKFRVYSDLREDLNKSL